MKFSSPLSFTRILGFLALGCTLLAFTGCVSQDEHKRLQTAFDQARAQLAEAENENVQLRAKVAELENKIAELNRLLASTNTGADALRLAQQLKDLQDKYNQLLANSEPALPIDVTNALRDLAKRYPGLMDFDERTGMIRLKSDVTFELGSTVVRPQARMLLKELADVFNYKEIANYEIQVVGHTDDVPIRKSTTMTMNPTNWHLSTNRSWAVLDVLHESGLTEARGEAAGWGEQRPIAPNAPGKRGNEQNRRVDIYIRPTTVPAGIVISTPGAAAPAPRAPAPRRAPTTPAPAPTPVPPTTAPAVPLPM